MTQTPFSPPNLEFADYRIIDTLHQSFTTLIYKAYDDTRKKIVSIKTNVNDYPSIQEINGLQHEFSILQKLMNPDQVLLKKWHQKTLLVYDYFEGENLAKVIPHNLPIEQFFSLALEIAQKLAEIQDKSIIHKCLNPHNILYNSQTSEVKIIDFSLAVETNQESQQLTSLPYSDTILPYISPEQTGRINRYLDYRSDFYSLGMTFYRLLTGITPFHADNVMGWIHSHIAHQPLPIPEIIPTIPDMVNTIIEKLIAKNSEDRYQSLTGLIYDLSECREQYTRHKKVNGFTPGLKDRASHFQISKKIYGRDQEFQVLTTCMKEVFKGKIQLLTISGLPGIGKTSLIQEYFNSFGRRKITFIQGKFEQYTQNRPYSGLIDAINGLIKNILCENDEKLEKWRQKILDLVNNNTSNMLEIFPDLEKIIGRQKETPHHSSQESQIDFFRAWEHLLGLFAHKDQPLVLFLDDVHWSDLASRDLILSLMLGKRLPSFLLILAFRDHVSALDNSFLLWLGELSKVISIQTLMVHELDQDQVNRIVAATMNICEEKVKPLTAAIYSKTKGSPFFTTELLHNLYQNGHIFFSLDANSWQWNLDTISQFSVCENVVDFMVSRLRDLPENTKLLLMYGACIGTEFDLEPLVGTCNMSPTDACQALGHAVKENIIIPLGYELDGSIIDNTYANKPAEMINIHYRFQHDRIQQAAYGMIEPESPKTFHYKIGKFLYEKFLIHKREDLVIPIVNHYNETLEILYSEQEKYTLAEMNCLAAKKMKSAFAFTVAKKYLEIGLSLLSDIKSRNTPDLTLKLKSNYFDILYLCNDPKTTLAFSKELLAEPLIKEDRAHIYYVCCQLYNYIGENEAAIDAGLKGLACLGVHVPPVVKGKDVINLQQQLDSKLISQPLSDFTQLPLTKNRSHEVTLEILSKAYIYTVRSNHFCNYLIITGINLSLSQGVTSHTPLILANYAQYTGEDLHDWKRALTIMETASAINQRIPNPYAKCLIQYRLLTICYWNQRHFSYDDKLEEIKDLTEKYGYTNMFPYGALLILHIATDLNFIQQVERGNSYITLMEKAKCEYVWPLMKMCVNHNRNLVKPPLKRLSLDDDNFKFKNYIREFQTADKIGDTMGMSMYHIYMLQLCYIFGEYKQLNKHIRETDLTMRGDPFSPEHCFYTFLALCRMLPQARGLRRKKLILRMGKEIQRMKSWVNSCPQRFQHRYLLMEAELNASRGKLKRALRVYNQAITTAHENDFIFDEALINEITARFLCTHYNENTALLYIKNAHYLFHCCGAFEKTKHLEETYPQILHEELGGIASAVFPSHSLPPSLTNIHFQSLDLDIIALSKTISGLSEEVVLENLLHKLMNCIHENSGAERSLLLLKQDDDSLLVQAEISKENDFTVMQGTPYDYYPHLSIAIIQYVICTQDTVLLENATQKGDFTHDPVIQQNQTKSLVCLPIIHQQKLIGILYLSNNIITRAFTTSHLEVLKILIAQAAIAIRNANLYYNLERKVAERTREIHKLNQQLKERIVDHTEKLKHAQKEILSQEYKCELADITSGTLHNVKNILTSIKISGEMVRRNIKGQSHASLIKANTLLRKNLDSLEDFICNDPRGKALMEYYLTIEEQRNEEIKVSQQHLKRLHDKVDAIEKIVVTQQGYSKSSYLEEISLIEILEDALIMQSESLARYQIKVNRRFSKIPSVVGIKTKVMHILVNLIKNAREAMAQTPVENKRLDLSIFTDAEFCHLRVQDTGCGVAPEDLEKLFTHGFTTKKDGHGFGLYSCAAYMKEMKGSISLESEGVDKGATFTLQFVRK